MKKETVATINGVDIVCFSRTKNRLMPLKPICNALGVDSDLELMNIQDLGFGNKLVGLDDGLWEEYGAEAMPIQYVLGWVLNVKRENTTLESDALCIKYIHECIKAIADFVSVSKEQMERYEQSVLKAQALLDEIEAEDNEEL